MLQRNSANLLYYSYGSRDSIAKQSRKQDSYLSNNSIKDTSSDIIERNYMMHDKYSKNWKLPEYKHYSKINKLSHSVNDYLNPVKQYELSERSQINPLICNSGSYMLQKNKNYANSKYQSQSIDPIHNLTPVLHQHSTRENPNELTGWNAKYPYQNILQDNVLTIDRNSTVFRRVKPPVGNKAPTQIKDEMYMESNDSPEWLQIYNRQQLNEINNQYIHNNESLHVLSKFNRWITVTPRSKNRRHPLEQIKLTNLENSAIVPYWMHICPKVTQDDLFRPVQFKNDLREHTKVTMLIDKDQENARSDNLMNTYDQ